MKNLVKIDCFLEVPLQFIELQVVRVGGTPELTEIWKKILTEFSKKSDKQFYIKQGTIFHKIFFTNFRRVA